MKCGKGYVIDPDANVREVRFCHIETENGSHDGDHKTIYLLKELTWSKEQPKLQA